MTSFLRAGVLATLAVVSLQAADSSSEIRKAESAWAAAVVARNAAELERLFAPDLIYAHSTGVVENRQQYIDRLKSGAQKYDAITHESTRVVDYGDAAVAHSIVRMSGISNGRAFNDHVMMLHLWVKRNGAWQLAAHQTTKLAQ